MWQAQRYLSAGASVTRKPARPPRVLCHSQPGARRHDPSLRALAALGAHTHPAGMFVVSEAEAAAIRATFEQRGEFAARSSCAGCSRA